MFTYQQSTGEIRHNGAPMDKGYSGRAPYVNNAKVENIPNYGPIPRGVYTIEPPINHPKLGPCAMPLTPAPTNTMFGRSGFWIHGDSPDHQASEGCIVLDRLARELIAQSGDNHLEVIE